MTENVEAALVAAAMLLLCFLNIPIADTTEEDRFTPEFRADYEKRVDPVTRKLMYAVADFNEVYDPLQAKVEPILRFLQIPQHWLIYNHAPYEYRIMEVRVDGEIKFRTPGLEYGWKYWQLRHFRLAYQLNDMTRPGSRFKKWREFGRYVINEAWDDFPEADEIYIIWYSGRYPGVQMYETHRILSTGRGQMDYLVTPPTLAAPGPEGFPE